MWLKYYENFIVKKWLLITKCIYIRKSWKQQVTSLYASKGNSRMCGQKQKCVKYLTMPNFQMNVPSKWHNSTIVAYDKS